MKTFVLAISFLFSFALYSAEFKLGEITSDVDKNRTDFMVLTDEANLITSFRLVTYLPNGGIDSDETYWLEDIQEEGVVVVERNGYNVVILKARNFSSATGGSFEMDYLYSGITGSRKKLQMQLAKMADAFVLQREANPVNRIFLKGNYNRFFGLIGISEIRTSYIAKDFRPLLY